ncbi:hypothetical protein IWX46DRAFT_598129 [Phyllosticta citricarpa]|uniref:Secreted protein n=1 Tax=Phyllosticta citricarpa TaxID=55181 RepID=A0ABR1MF08_9PEZI
MSPLQLVLPSVLVVICTALHCTALHCTARPSTLCARSAFSHSTSYLALPYFRALPSGTTHDGTSTHVAKSSRLTSATNTPHLIAVCPRAVVAFTCLFWKSTHAKSGWPAMLFCQC